MRYPLPSTRARQGVVLLIVITMLALFASVALSFVFYAESEANASLISRSSQTNSFADIDPEVLMSYALGQLNYGTKNPYSAMRAHSLAETLYGNLGTGASSSNVTPFNGLGRPDYKWVSNPVVNQPFSINFPPYAPATAKTIQLRHFVNFQDFSKTDGFARDPEYHYYQDLDSASPTYKKMLKGMYVGANAPYTYPDANNMFLASVNANGEVLMPSFYRPWIVNTYYGTPGLPDYKPYWSDTPTAPTVSKDTNYGATSPYAKYLSVRPHRSYNDQFPDPEDGYADVKNFEFGKGWQNPSGVPPAPAGSPNVYANNDSFWMDMGFPVMTAPNGKKYKPLFAWFITDLDNRLNLWLSGTSGGTSNQGFGAPEINLGVNDTSGNPLITAAELAQLFNKRYGGSKSNNNYPSSGPITSGPSWSTPVNFNPINGNSGLGPVPNFQIFPKAPTAWDNGAGAAAFNNNNLAYNLAYQTKPQPTPPGDQYFPPVSEMEPLLRYFGTNSLGQTSLVYSNMRNTPTTLSSLSLSNSRTRSLVTFLSSSFDRPLGSPYLWTDANAKTQPAGITAPTYDLAAGDSYPKNNGYKFPDLTKPTIQPNSEYMSGQIRSNMVQAIRTNLYNPNLPAYPTPDPTQGSIKMSPANSTLYKSALDARQALAQNIYNELILVTGAQDPTKFAANGGTVSSTSTQYAAARWLAQLAVNIVDYIDSDDYITVWKWYPAGTATDAWVYGTELPRVVLNEAYISYDNDPADLTGADVSDKTKWNVKNYNLNFWVELLNPFPSITDTPTSTPPFIRDNGIAKLVLKDINNGNADYPVYQLAVCPTDTTFITDPANTAGDLDTANPFYSAPIGTNASDWGVKEIAPVDGRTSDPNKASGNANGGFYVLGNNATFTKDTNNTTSLDPKLPTTTTINGMQVKIPQLSDPTTQAAPKPLTPSIVLRRLAVPHLPYTDLASATATKPYNPYITIDYFTKLNINDNRVAKITGGTTTINASNYANSVAYGRRQPFTANAACVVAQAPKQLKDNKQNDPTATWPKHTFFMQNLVDILTPTDKTINTTLQYPFDWLVHLDRPLVNSLELLHVSGYRPCDLTQNFSTNAVTNYKHTAPWTDQQALIYRALDILGGPSRQSGTFPGGRIPGQVNVNTINDPEPLLALGDAQTFSSFKTADVLSVYSKIIASRMPTGIYSESDVPFKNFTAGYIPTGDANFKSATGKTGLTGVGFQETLLRDDPGAAGTPLFQTGAAADNPYKRYELLSKIANNVTTTSNVFAAWCTVGFFEVTDETAQPPKLGAEIGRADNRHVRHRFFAIIDRSEMTLFNSTNATYTPKITTTTPPTPAKLTINDITNINIVDNNIIPSQLVYPTPTSRLASVKLNQGDTMLLEVSDGVNTEIATAVVTVTDNWTLTLSDNLKLVTIPTSVICRGNPGPQNTDSLRRLGYNHRNDPKVVPHYSLIE